MNLDNYLAEASKWMGDDLLVEAKANGQDGMVEDAGGAEKALDDSKDALNQVDKKSDNVDDSDAWEEHTDKNAYEGSEHAGLQREIEKKLKNKQSVSKSELEALKNHTNLALAMIKAYRGD